MKPKPIDQAVHSIGLGDVVVLKSGGPQMTVVTMPHQCPNTGSLTEQSVFCAWFDHKGLHEEPFPVKSLDFAPAV